MVAIGVERDVGVGRVEDAVAVVVGAPARQRRNERPFRFERLVAGVREAVAVGVLAERIVKVLAVEYAVRVGVGVNHGREREGADDE